RQTQIGIVEMGANHEHEIAFLCSIAKPDYGYITNFGKAHLEGFGSPEGVIRGKSELYDYLAANDKLAFVNIDDPLQYEKTRPMNLHTFGNNTKADVIIESASANPFVVLNFEQTDVTSNLIGIYNSGNINAAVAIGKYFAIGNAAIKEAIESY